MPPLYWKEMDRASKQEKSTGESKRSLWKIFSEGMSSREKQCLPEPVEAMVNWTYSRRSGQTRPRTPGNLAAGIR